MKAVQPLISYYPADNSKFIDPLYVPYQRKLVSIPGEGCKTFVNTWPKGFCPEQTYPDHYRMGWNSDFLRMHPNDPCPPGWVDTGNGMCSRAYTSSHDSNFYTSDLFAVDPQFLDGYTVNRGDIRGMNKLKNMITGPELNKLSVNPNTGNYVDYHGSKPNINSTKYNVNPARFSYCRGRYIINEYFKFMQIKCKKLSISFKNLRE